MPKMVLTIDDDPYIRQVHHRSSLRQRLRDLFRIQRRGSPFRPRSPERPDLVTLDMEMPDEWGPRFYRKMSMNPAFKDTPVIVISGLQGIHLAIRNAVATLQKPFDPEELLSIVNRVL